MENQKNNPHKRQGKDTKKERSKRLFKILWNKPTSRRMAATSLGFEDQTYMVTQCIIDWIKQGKAEVVGKVRCPRSKRFVQGVTTNPAYFSASTQLNLFE